MKIDDIITELKKMKIPIRYTVFRGKPSQVPFIVYKEIESVSFYADGINYYTTAHYSIEVYVEKKEPKIEKAIEAVLGDKVTWSKTEDYVPEEKLILINYEFKMEV